jgi:serine phosphatase RsbU (regulator of sigma subunit)
LPVVDAYRLRRPIVLERAQDWLGYDDELREAVNSSGWPVVMALPLETRTRVVGAIYVNFPSGEPADEPTRAFLGAVASMASTTLDRLQLFDQARRAQAEAGSLLRGLQAALVPTPDPGLPVHTVYRPGDERMLLGGDFFDVLAGADGRLSAIVGDVAGHGPAAAGVGAQLRTAWRTLTLRGIPDSEVLPTLDALLRSTGAGDELFATVLCLGLEGSGGRCVMAVAGHPAPVVLGRGRSARAIAPVVGPPVGLGLAEQWPTFELTLGSGEQMLLFTDGLFEGRAAPGSRERLGIDGLLTLLADGGPLDAGGLSALVDRVEEAHGGPLPDDVALLALQG